MTSPLSPITTTDRRASGSSLGSTPYSNIDSTSSSPAVVPVRTAAELANLRYRDPRHSLPRVIEGSPIGSGSGSSLSIYPFLPPVHGAGEPVSSSPSVSSDLSTRRYSLVPKATKEDTTEGVRPPSPLVSAGAKTIATASLFLPPFRRLSGPVLLPPLDKDIKPKPPEF